jgi:hypothetical protein
MKTSSLLIVPFLLLTTAFANAQRTTYTTQVDTARGASTVRGHAVYEDSEKPVRRVAVCLMNTESKLQRWAVTDGNGDFVFKNVAAGTYRVLVAFGGRMNGFPRNDLNSPPGEQVTVDGSSSIDVRIRATRGASITGRVTYPDGEPVIGAQINVFRKVGKQWVHEEIVTSGNTDDRGIFRLYPLRAGEYAINAIEQSLKIEERDGAAMQSVSNESVSPYFYNDAPNLKNATIIQVDAGRETPNINFTLTARALYEVSGTLTVNQKPMAGIYLTLNLHDDVPGLTGERANGQTVEADKNGHWIFKSVPDGTYDVELDSIWSGRLPKSPFERYLAIRQVVTIAGADLADIAINLTEAGRISGSITMEGGKPLPRGLNATSSSTNDNYHSTQNLEIDQTGKFVLSGVAPGENLFRIDSDSKFFVKSMTWKGRDLLRQPIKVEAGLESSGVSVVLSTEFGSLIGRVLSPLDRKPLARRPFGLLPVDETRWKDGTGSISGITNEEGIFKISGAPGEYIMVVVPDGPNTITTFEALKELALKSPRVTLRTTPGNEVEIIPPN